MRTHKCPANHLSVGVTNDTCPIPGCGLTGLTETAPIDDLDPQGYHKRTIAILTCLAAGEASIALDLINEASPTLQAMSIAGLCMSLLQQLAAADGRTFADELERLGLMSTRVIDAVRNGELDDDG